jgi:hypothetical protein
MADGENVGEIYSNAKKRRSDGKGPLKRGAELPKKPSPLSSEDYPNPSFFALEDVQFGGKRRCPRSRRR